MMPSYTRWCRHIPDDVVRYQMMPSDTRRCRHIPDDVVIYHMMSSHTRWCRHIPDDAVRYQMMLSDTRWFRHITDAKEFSFYESRYHKPSALFFSFQARSQKLQTATIRYVMSVRLYVCLSVRPSVRTTLLSSHGFSWNLILEYFFSKIY